MPVFIRNLKAAASAALWRPFDATTLVGRVGGIVGLAILLVVASVLLDWIFSGFSGRFQIHGINSAVAAVAVQIGVIALFAARGAKPLQTILLMNLLLLSVVVIVIVGHFENIALFLGLDGVIPNSARWAGIAGFLLYLLWMTGAVRKIFLVTEGALSHRLVWRSLSLVLGLIVLPHLLPTWPTFAGANFQRATANLWELASTYRSYVESTDEPVEDIWTGIELAQPRLLQEALSRLDEARPETGRTYVISVAGWSEQDVFMRESEATVGVFDQLFGAGASALQLVNNDRDVQTIPLASPTNLSAAVQAVGRRMNQDKDVLVLFLTSHGDRSGVALEYRPLVRRTLSPANLKAVLDAAEIKNRIVIVSACHSGVFVPVLADENSVVVTASSAETNSFGCSNEREWTYFGDAFINRGLRETKTIPDAFEKARLLITEWESRDGLTASDPQLHIGSAIRELRPDLLGPALQKPAGSRDHSTTGQAG